MTQKQLKKLKRTKSKKLQANKSKNQSSIRSIPTDENPFWDSLSGPESPMLHSKDFIPHDCTFCGKLVASVQDSHNAYPLRQSTTVKSENGAKENARCCSDCNQEKVIPARLYLAAYLRDRDAGIEP
jgi:hypothetical protein